jgi:3-methyladenine DNA glycosylase AlkD
MASAASILGELKKKGNEKTRKIYARHGMAEELVLGVSVADLKTIAKGIRGQQELAYQLYETGMMEAMYLAGMVADGAPMPAKLLNQWAESAANLQMISEYTVPWVTAENAGGRALALKWMESKKEHVAAAGWCTYSGLLATKADGELDLGEIEKLLGKVVEGISRAQKRERYTMNGFVISTGAYVQPLAKQAKAAAREIGEVSVDVGNTACKVPVALEYIAKLEDAGRVGRKRKTIRC